MKRSLRKAVDGLVLAICVFVLVTPAISVFLWMLSLAFKNEVDNLAYPPVFLPDPPTLANFRAVFDSGPFFSYLTMDEAILHVDVDQRGPLWDE